MPTVELNGLVTKAFTDGLTGAVGGSVDGLPLVAQLQVLRDLRQIAAAPPPGEGSRRQVRAKARDLEARLEAARRGAYGF